MEEDSARAIAKKIYRARQNVGPLLRRCPTNEAIECLTQYDFRRKHYPSDSTQQLIVARSL
jgi:hypothetical protein